MNVRYKEKGTPGKTCADCRHFEADRKTRGIGKCFGYEVKAEAGCNYFEPKKK